jgi:hypothetical protein
MDPTQVASLTGLLTLLGLGKYTAGIVSLIALAFAVAPQIMPFLPVPETTSAQWYRAVYGVLAKMTGNRGPNTPVPASTLAVAKAVQVGFVPTPIAPVDPIDTGITDPKVTPHGVLG